MKKGLRVWSKRVAVAILATVAAVVAIALVAVEIGERRLLASTQIAAEKGIESLEQLEIGGVPQTIYMRGHDRTNPVLLFLHGGPGGASMPLARDFGDRLEKHFVVVHWDQRGAGNSCSPDVPDESLRLEQFLADTLQLVNVLRARFGTEKIFLVGHSWGSVLGVLTIQRHPELFHAYVGMGQIVDMARNEEISYRFVEERAHRENNEEAIAALSTIHPPYENTDELMLQRAWLGHYRGDHLAGGLFERFARAIVVSPEYSLRKKISFYSCMMNSLDHAWNELDEIDFIETARRLEVPVFFFAGRHDYNTPFELVEEYFELLEAPSKELVWFENSAHSPNLEEPERYQSVLIERVSSTGLDIR